MTSPLRAVTPEERLLETMRLIRDTALKGSSKAMLQICTWASDAVAEYRDSLGVVPTRRIEQGPNHMVVGEIQSKGGR